MNMGSSSSNPPVSNPNGHFSTKAADRAQRKDTAKLSKDMRSFRNEPIEDIKTTHLNDVYTALECGVAIPKSPQEHCLVECEQQLGYWELLRTVMPPFDSLNARINEIKDHLKKYQDNNGHYNTDTLYTDETSADETYKVSSAFDQKVLWNGYKDSARKIFKENPQLLFEKAAAYPESVQRLVELLELPLQNDKGWNLTSQAAKAGNPKLAKAFEKAGFGSNLYPKVVVDFAKAMTDDAPNADKSKALKELMGVTPLS